MPLTWKTTWDFEGPQSAVVGLSANPGWSETWYQVENDVERALINGYNPAPDAWITLRRQFLSSTYRISRVRVSCVTNPRLTKGAVLIGMEGVQPKPAAQVNCCILADCTVLPTSPTDITHHRRVQLRGLPLEIINGDVIQNASPTLGLVRQFLNLVANHETNVSPRTFTPQWLIQFQDPTVRPVHLSGLAVAANPHRITITNEFGVLAPDSRIRLSGVKFPSFMNRVWKVISPTPTDQPYTLGESKRQLAGVWDGTGKAVVVEPQYAPANQYTIVGLRSRDTGRPPTRSRGRRSVA